MKPYAGPTETDLKPDFDAMVAHLEAWFAPASAGVIEICLRNPYNGGIFQFSRFALTDVMEAAEHAAHHNEQPGCDVYYRVCTVDPPGDGWTADEHFCQGMGVHVDLDDEGSADRAPNLYTALPPTAAIVTGRHPHKRAQLLWASDEPIIDPAQVRAMAMSACQMLDGDQAVVNPTRMMRIGGSIAWPYKEGRRIELTEFQDLRGRGGRPEGYGVARLQQFFSQVAPTDNNTVPADDGKPRERFSNHLDVYTLLERTRQPGQWHINMRDAIASMVARNWPDSAIRLACAAYCDKGANDPDLAPLLRGARQKFEMPDPEVTETVTTQAAGVIEILSYAELKRLPKPQWLIQDVLLQDSFSVLFGAPGSYKSFVAIDWALSIIHGGHWNGHPINHSGPCVYVAGEGVGGLQKRIEAWHREHGIDDDDVALFTVRTSVDLVDEKSGCVEALIEAIRAKIEGCDPALIVIDTLARTFISGDENSTQDMNRFVANCGRLRMAFPGCHLMTVHHSGKDPTKGDRGSSALRGAADTRFSIERDEGTPLACIKNLKQKDYEEAPPVWVRAEKREWAVGFDEVSSLVLVPVDEPQASVEKPLNDEQKIMLEVLVDALHNATHRIDDRPAVPVSFYRSLVEDRFREKWSAERMNGRLKRLEQRQKIIRANGLISMNGTMNGYERVEP